MTNDDLLRQLGDIAQLALRDYPYTENWALDGDLLITLGQIAGMARKAIAEYKGEALHPRPQGCDMKDGLYRAVRIGDATPASRIPASPRARSRGVTVNPPPPVTGVTTRSRK